MNERLQTEITDEDGVGSMRDSIRVEVTADLAYEGEFNEIRDAVHEILDGEVGDA